MIVTILQQITQAVNFTPQPTFAHGEQFEQNTHDDTTLPLVYLEHPLKAKDTILPQGQQEPTYTLNLFFLNRSNLDDTINERQPIVDSMHALKRKFIVKLLNDSRVKSIDSLSHVEVYNVLDLNLDGLWCTLTLTLIDGASVCQ